MPRRKPKPEKIIQERIKESLDSILEEESLDLIDSILPENGELPRMKSTELMNFADEKNSALADAKQLLDSLAAFYIDPKQMEEASHVEFKKKMDSINLSSMMFQLKSAQHAITKLLEEIDLGNTQPRVFEVLAQLQSQIMQMPKDYQSYLEKMEQNYKKTRIEIDSKNEAKAVVMEPTSSDGVFTATSVTPEGGLRSRGTRGIMEGLRGIIGTEIIDVKPEMVSPNSVVNAREKKKIDLDNAPESARLNSDEILDDDDNLEIEDEIFK